MSESQRTARSSVRRMREVLLAHLQRCGGCTWPGVDGLSVEDVLAYYLPAVEAGRVPGREQLLADHPDLAVELSRFFAGAEALAHGPR